MDFEKEIPENILNEPAMEFGHEYTYSDYLKFEFEEMVELIKGKIFRMSPAPKAKHQAISVNIIGEIWTYLKGKKCQVYPAPFDVVLPIANKKRNKATTVVQPDISVICDLTIIEENGCFGVPNWIIEILSDSTAKKDKEDKYNVYQEAGVNEYWIVMPEQQLIEVFLLENGKYNRAKVYIKSDKISPTAFPDLLIDLNEIF